MGNVEPIRTIQIQYDDLSYDYVASRHQRVANNIYNPLIDSDATDALASEINYWKQEDTVTVFTSGVFDMLHLDHSGYLLHTKATGAAEHYKRHADNDTPWELQGTAFQENYTDLALSLNALRLVVSIDGDRSVAIRKGFNPDKGNVPRPIYAWQTRALQVANQSFITPHNTSYGLLPIVDAVTIHGPEDFDADSPHNSHFDLVEKLQPDVWAIFGESKDILDEAPRKIGLGNVALRCIRDGQGTHYYVDGNIGKMSTTSIIQRLTETA